MEKKVYLSITGPSTVGKSTLAQALSGLGWAIPVPQTTKRPKRSDDNPDFIKYLDPKDFYKGSFFVKHGNYGILSKDFSDFSGSNSRVGVSVNGPNEIFKIQKAFKFSTPLNHSIDIECLNILIRYSNDQDVHVKQWREGLTTHFSSAVANQRISINEQLDRDFYFNNQFVDNHIDVILTRDSSIADWVSIISQHPSINSFGSVQRGLLKPNEP